MKLKKHIDLLDNHITKYGPAYILVILIVFGIYCSIKRKSDNKLLISNNKSTIGKIVDVKFSGKIDSYKFTFIFNVKDSNYYSEIVISGKDLDNLKCRIGHYYKVIYKPDDINNNQLLVDSFVRLSGVREFFRNKINPFKVDSLLLIDSIGKETAAVIIDSRYNLIGRYSFAYSYKVDNQIYQVVINECSKMRFRVGDRFKLKYMDNNKESHYFYFYDPIK
jgi:hypothetical protein